MILKRSLIFVSILLVVAMLGACVRSASTPPTSNVPPPTSQPVEEASPAAGGKAPEGQPPEGQPQPEVTNEVLQQLAQFVTQTAAAAQIAAGQVPGQPQPGGVNAEGTPYPLMETPATGAGTPGGESAQATEQAAGGQTGSQGTSPEATQTSEAAGGQQPVAPQPTETSEPAGGQQPVAPQPTQTSEPSGGQQPVAPQPTQAVEQPTQSAEIVVPTSTPGIPSSYTLQPGEFPYCIARRFNVNPFELLSINGLTTSSVVRGGTTLRIPQTGNHFPGERSLKSHPTTYTVGSGENIYMVACKFGDVGPDAIGYANGLSVPYTLTAGQTLNIP